MRKNKGKYDKKVNKITKKARLKSGFSLSEAKLRLTGGRFRHLNEKLYSSSSEDNWKLYNKDRNLFNIYHEGFRHQISQWPYNPLTKVIEWLKDNNCKTIGDFGCGDALIAKTFPNRTVYSYDLVSTNALVTACNIAEVPLSDDTLDVCIFCLSLMGKDWPLFVKEATRCLKILGILKIVEVKSRFKEIKSFVRFIKSFGYIEEDAKELNDDENDFFIFFNFKLNEKVQINKEDILRNNGLLSPCLYKHR